MSTAEPLRQRASLKVEWALLGGLAVAAVAVGQHPRRGAGLPRRTSPPPSASARARTSTAPSDGAMPFKYAPSPRPCSCPSPSARARPRRCGTWARWPRSAPCPAHLARGAWPGEPAPWHWAPALATVALLPAFSSRSSMARWTPCCCVVAGAGRRGRGAGPRVGPRRRLRRRVLLKPPAALLGLFFLARRHWRVVRGPRPFGVLLVLPTWAAMVGRARCHSA